MREKYIEELKLNIRYYGREYKRLKHYINPGAVDKYVSDTVFININALAEFVFKYKYVMKPEQIEAFIKENQTTFIALNDIIDTVPNSITKLIEHGGSYLINAYRNNKMAELNKQQTTSKEL